MLVHELTLPNLCEVGKNVAKLHLISECIRYAVDKGKFDCNPDKLQLAEDLKFILSTEIMEYEDWMEACKEFLEEQRLRRNIND